MYGQKRANASDTSEEELVDVFSNERVLLARSLELFTFRSTADAVESRELGPGFDLRETSGAEVIDNAREPCTFLSVQPTPRTARLFCGSVSFAANFMDS